MRIFMQIPISLYPIRQMESIKFISPTKYYNEYYTFDTLYVSACHVHFMDFYNFKFYQLCELIALPTQIFIMKLLSIIITLDLIVRKRYSFRKFEI